MPPGAAARRASRSFVIARGARRFVPRRRRFGPRCGDRRRGARRPRGSITATSPTASRTVRSRASSRPPTLTHCRERNSRVAEGRRRGARSFTRRRHERPVRPRPRPAGVRRARRPTARTAVRCAGVSKKACEIDLARVGARGARSAVLLSSPQRELRAHGGEKPVGRRCGPRSARIVELFLTEAVHVQGVLEEKVAKIFLSCVLRSKIGALRVVKKTLRVDAIGGHDRSDGLGPRFGRDLRLRYTAFSAASVRASGIAFLRASGRLRILFPRSSPKAAAWTWARGAAPRGPPTRAPVANAPALAKSRGDRIFSLGHHEASP